MKIIDGQEKLKISELAEAAGVSTSTIHYYVQEGLLTAPVRTSRNMAYYDRRCIQEIRFIQELQAKQYLPLTAIKLLLKARQEGQAAGHQVEMRTFMEKIFQPVGKEGSSGLTLDQLASESGLTVSDIQNLQQSGLIEPRKEPNQPVYDDIDLQIASRCKRLFEIGLKPDDLAIFSQYIEVVRAQNRALHQLFHRLPDHDSVPVAELAETTKKLKDLLDARAYRSEASHFMDHQSQEG